MGINTQSQKPPAFRTLQPIQTKPQPTIIMDKINNAANYVSESVKGAVNTGSKEANKEVAKDSNADASTRLSAGKDALGDKVDEKKHNVSAETNKEAAKH